MRRHINTPGKPDSLATLLKLAAWQVGLARLADRFGKGLRTAPRDALIADTKTRRAARGSIQ